MQPREIMRNLLSLFATSLCLVAARREIKEYVIDLDKDPADRYLELLPQFNSSVWGFYDAFFANDKALTDFLYLIVDERGPEPEEMQAEIIGMAKASGLPLKFVNLVQLLYELQTLMVPVENFTKPVMPAGYEILERIPWRGPGCTGIIATGKDNTVYHARNLDFSPVKYMTELVYTGIFHKGGKEVFRSQMIAGYSAVITGMKMGPDGFTIERNTRYTDHVKGNEQMIHNLLKEKRPTNGWQLRKILETAKDYEDAVAKVSAAPYISTEYAIMSGVKKGTILAKNPDDVAHVQTLGETNFEERADYIIMTNFDFFFHDIREWFDPTGGKIGRPRRIEAQKILNATKLGELTGEILFDTINAPGVIADTIFQMVANVETGLWNVSQPDL